MRDTGTGRTAAGPHTCSGLAYADRQVARDCGPSTVSLPHGHSYQVVVSWTYTKEGISARGTQNGTTFAW